MAAFTKEQWLTIITFVVVNFCNAMCVSMQVRRTYSKYHEGIDRSIRMGKGYDTESGGPR